MWLYSGVFRLRKKLLLRNSFFDELLPAPLAEISFLLWKTQRKSGVSEKLSIVRRFDPNRRERVFRHLGKGGEQDLGENRRCQLKKLLGRVVPPLRRFADKEHSKRKFHVLRFRKSIPFRK